MSKYVNENGKFNHGKWQREFLTEAPMDQNFQKEWEKSCTALLNHIEYEQKSSKLGAHKGTVDKMIDTLRVVKGYPELMSNILGSEFPGQ